MKTLEKLRHNHIWLESTDQQLFHPQSDPRTLQITCPACKEYMQNWIAKNQQMMNDCV